MLSLSLLLAVSLGFLKCQQFETITGNPQKRPVLSGCGSRLVPLPQRSRKCAGALRMP